MLKTELADHSGQWVRQTYDARCDYRKMTKANIDTYRYVLGEDWLFIKRGTSPMWKRCTTSAR
ncbi:MAG: hypothetical protein HN687_12700 [Candidatus Marinimicrobia bacterium]|jgi:hypothetical protein|nr:hypothetical protein [Candidatus Neomarinimicrobiota bacterium]